MTDPPHQQDLNLVLPETADIETSSEEYANRFSGAVGEWMLRVQADLVLQVLEGVPVHPVLDVGGGHGQLAGPLCKRGFPVTVLGSAPGCRKRVSALVDSGDCTFVTGNVIDLPFEDRSFDTVLSFRLVTHCRQWRTLLRELTRVARRRVIVDYPTSQSVNALAPALFGAKKKIEVDTRTWALFTHRQILEAFAENGFALKQRHAQFFLPMVLHRMLRMQPLSAALEGACRAMGLTRLWGSPVIVEMVPGDA